MSNVDGHTIYMHIGCLNCTKCSHPFPSLSPDELWHYSCDIIFLGLLALLHAVNHQNLDGGKHFILLHIVFWYITARLKHCSTEFPLRVELIPCYIDLSGIHGPRPTLHMWAPPLTGKPGNMDSRLLTWNNLEMEISKHTISYLETLD